MNVEITDYKYGRRLLVDGEVRVEVLHDELAGRFGRIMALAVGPPAIEAVFYATQELAGYSDRYHPYKFAVGVILPEGKKVELCASRTGNPGEDRLLPRAISLGDGIVIEVEFALTDPRELTWHQLTQNENIWQPRNPILIYLPNTRYSPEGVRAYFKGMERGLSLNCKDA